MRRKTAENILSEMPDYLHVVGSYARGEQIVNDLDFVTTKNLNAVKDELKAKFGFRFERFGPKNLVGYKKNICIDIWKATKPTLKFMKMYRTLAAGEIIGLRKLARAKGYIFRDTGLYHDKIRLNVNSKKELKRILKN